MKKFTLNGESLIGILFAIVGIGYFLSELDKDRFTPFLTSCLIIGLFGLIGFVDDAVFDEYLSKKFFRFIKVRPKDE